MNSRNDRFPRTHPPNELLFCQLSPHLSSLWAKHGDFAMHHIINIGLCRGRTGAGMDGSSSGRSKSRIASVRVGVA